jgi:MerR family transcriptional regulator, heat shock protein HspR
LEQVENFELPLYPISSAAKILGISVHTLRMYEKEGLILPFKKESSHRLYSESDIQRLLCIRRAINVNKISINGIKAIYSLIPCWEINNCSKNDRNNCEAFISHSRPCWSFKHSNNICYNKECRNCNVYKDFTECGKIKDLITSKVK